MTEEAEAELALLAMADSSLPERLHKAKRNLHELNVGVNPPLPPNEIRAYERQHGFTLPDDYRAFLQFIGNDFGHNHFGKLPALSDAEARAVREPFVPQMEPLILNREEFPYIAFGSPLDHRPADAQVRQVFAEAYALTETGRICLTKIDIGLHYRWINFLVVTGPRRGLVYALYCDSHASEDTLRATLSRKGDILTWCCPHPTST